MVKIKTLFLPALLWLTVFALLPSALRAQSDLETRVSEYRASIKEVVQNVLTAFEEWDQTLLGNDRSKVQAAFDNLKTTSNLEVLRLGANGIPLMEGDTSYIFAANKLVYYIAKQCRWDLENANNYVVGYSKTEYQSKEYIGIIEDVKREVENKISKMDWAERELIASLLIKPQSEVFCYSFSAMLPETQAAFPNLKGAYLSTTDMGYEKYEATQLFSMAKNGAVYISEKKQYAEFLMAESADSAQALSIQSEIACYIMCCDVKGWKRFAGALWPHDKAAISAIEFKEPQRFAWEVTSALRRDDKYGPYQVYLQFWKLL